MKGERGQAFALALIILALGMLVVAPFLGHAGSTLIGSRIYGQATAEQYAADAGVEYAIWQLQSGGLQVPEGEEQQLPEFTLNEKIVGVTVHAEGDDFYQVTSSAISGDGGSTTIESRIFSAYFEEFPGDLELDEDEQYSSNVIVGGNLKMEGGAQLMGDVIAEGNVQLDDEAQVIGRVRAGENVQLDDEAEIAGDVCAGGSVHLDDRSQIIGDVRAVGDVHLKIYARIDGDVYTGGIVYLDDGAEITGNIYPYQGCQFGIDDTMAKVLTWEPAPNNP